MGRMKRIYSFSSSWQQSAEVKSTKPEPCIAQVAAVRQTTHGTSGDFQYVLGVENQVFLYILATSVRLHSRDSNGVDNRDLLRTLLRHTSGHISCGVVFAPKVKAEGTDPGDREKAVIVSGYEL
ncbi:hypothetical protein ACJJTC_008890 [Scirpophaga incertulas]